jgi:hypothetical protein
MLSNWQYGRGRTFFAAAALSAAAALTTSPAAGDTPDVAALQRQIDALKLQVDQLRAESGEQWLTAARAEQVRQIARDVVGDAASRQAGQGPSFGYKNGFFLRTADDAFRLSIGGFVQARYTFADSQNTNPAAFPTAPRAGDANGFDFRRARLIFSGNALTPDLTYVFSMDFAGDYAAKAPVSSVAVNPSGGVSTSQVSVPADRNFAQIVDLFVAYRFSDAINVRVGSFLTPFSRAECTVAGAEFVDLPTVLSPFDPQRSLGVSVYGQLVKDRLAYELNVNNGQCSSTLGRAAEISTGGATASSGGGTDNRLAFYARLQYAGAGKLSDFADEPDLRPDTSALAWVVDAAAGYESANATSSAFPSPQGGMGSIPVGSADAPGFATYALNGDIFRGTVDAAAKYRGWSFTLAGYFQQINENPPAPGGTAPALPAGYRLDAGGRSSFFQVGYYGQAGYMVTKNLELAVRAGQFVTEGSPNQSMEYAVAATYFLYGHNLKLQSDFTFVPGEAAFTSSTLGTAANTQDAIFRLQLQLKF